MPRWEERGKKKKERRKTLCTISNQQHSLYSKLVKSLVPYPTSGFDIESFHHENSLTLRNIGHFPNYRRMPLEVFKTQLKKASTQASIFGVLYHQKKLHLFLKVIGCIHYQTDNSSEWPVLQQTHVREERSSPCRAWILSPIPSSTWKLPFSIMPGCACQLSASWHKDIAG